MSADLKLVTPGPGAPLDEGSDASDDNVMKGAFTAMRGDSAGAQLPLHLEAESIARIQRTMQAEQGSRSRRFVVGGALAMAAAAAMALTWGFAGADEPLASLLQQKGQVEAREAGSSDWTVAGGETELGSGAALRTGAGSSAELAMAPGVDVSVAADTELAWPQEGVRLVELARGSVSFKVSPLPDGQSFVVAAGQTRVVVHGTEFSVTMLEEGAAPCVIVSEGLVEVLSPAKKVWVSAGQETGCELPVEEAKPAEAPQPEVPAAEKKPSAQAKAKVAHRAQRKEEKPASSLAEQNALFQRALVAERAGDIKGARGHLNTFLKKYPKSPLTNQVRAQRASLKDR
jgi:ferric-dicitrate binding protein FerR (iron transport regulator)